MKKMITGMILLMMLIVSACSNANQAGDSNTNDGSQPDANSGNLKVVLLVPGTLGDKSFFDAANAGLTKVHDMLGAETKVIEMGADETKWEPTFNDIASQDWDVIISGGSQITELLNDVASRNPDKKFINYDTDIEDTAENVHAISYATNEVSFLAGAAAALISTSDMPNANPDQTIGFVGGMDIPGINTFLVGYIEGAKYVDPDIKVAISYAGNFVNPAKGKELSLLQYNAGADVIFSVAGGTGLGVFDAAKEKQKYAIGVDSDQSAMIMDTDSEKANLIVTSAIKKIDEAIFNAVAELQKGTLEMGKFKVVGFNESGVALAENNVYNSVVSESVRAEVAKIKEQIATGQIEISNALHMDTAQIDALRNSVKP
ncbi:BMP family ABC transporter substrate-binding protein [Paenibacillus sp. MSJ-34]|uniref:BMP family ABC transporter substrate-binding protein n=1 Tax=Paenibacillus sp. MSJ-34 TaxID=2841529 RepID=UPI001C1015AE|nr:BMP family ABC transporter substrate-binding protein [Paenibacillus sp. MSJ-34]MBU5441121.1 BMP family ABC transporter substrate-binding protein [Paenibacillus sp. MSJ-34]